MVSRCRAGIRVRVRVRVRVGMHCRDANYEKEEIAVVQSNSCR